MRGAPHVTFDLDILRMRPTSSRSRAGRPTRPALLMRVQNRLNPSRCHRITVAGWTIARAYRHASQRRARTTHIARSQRPKRGCRPPRARVSTPIWWRSARFSSASSRFVRNDDLAAPKIKLCIPRTVPTQDAAAQLISCGRGFRQAQDAVGPRGRSVAGGGGRSWREACGRPRRVARRRRGSAPREHGAVGRAWRGEPGEEPLGVSARATGTHGGIVSSGTAARRPRRGRGVPSVCRRLSVRSRRPGRARRAGRRLARRR